MLQGDRQRWPPLSLPEMDLAPSSSFPTCGEASGRGASPPVTHFRSTSFGQAPARPRSIASMSLGDQTTPRILPPVTRCLVLQLSLPCVLGEPLAASSWEPRPQTPPTLQMRPRLPRDALLPQQPALCTCSSQHSPARPLPLPLPPSPGLLGAAAVQPEPGVEQPGWNVALPLLSLAQLRPKTRAEKGLSLWYPLPRAGS